LFAQRADVLFDKVFLVLLDSSCYVTTVLRSESLGFGQQLSVPSLLFSELCLEGSLLVVVSVREIDVGWTKACVRGILGLGAWIRVAKDFKTVVPESHLARFSVEQTHHIFQAASLSTLRPDHRIDNQLFEFAQYLNR
jgi:hypothetical protein